MHLKGDSGQTSPGGSGPARPAEGSRGRGLPRVRALGGTASPAPGGADAPRARRLLTRLLPRLRWAPLAVGLPVSPSGRHRTSATAQPLQEPPPRPVSCLAMSGFLSAAVAEPARGAFCEPLVQCPPSLRPLRAAARPRCFVVFLGPSEPWLRQRPSSGGAGGGSPACPGWAHAGSVPGKGLSSPCL